MSGPRVVALGGGHGLAVTLSAVRQYAGWITAVVGVTDDGGSSGRIRADHDVPAMGDIRRCIRALAREESPWSAALMHRFDGSGLDGHALGNLMILGLLETGVPFVDAVAHVATVAGAAGRVLPACDEPVDLIGHLADGSQVAGQMAVSHAVGVRKVTMSPPDPSVPDEVAAEIAAADQILLGPGSLFTSVLAAAAVPAILAALETASAPIVYVANLAQQHPETSGFGPLECAATVVKHGIRLDTIVCDSGSYGDFDSAPNVVVADLAGLNRGQHDSDALAKVLADLAG